MDLVQTVESRQRLVQRHTTSTLIRSELVCRSFKTAISLAYINIGRALIVHSVTHSVMFHHFHNHDHPMGQGSLSQDEFGFMLDWLSSSYNLISADCYFQKAINTELKSNDICLSFDDALLCQYDVAVPVLNARRLKAFFFVYSSALSGEPDFLEIFRYFRTTAYSSVESFYEAFFLACEAKHEKDYAPGKTQFSALDYLKDFPFYTDGDRWFRYLRDMILGKERYESLMIGLMNDTGFDIEKAMGKLWVTDKQIRTMSEQGHIIGLHSYSHPTTMQNLSKAKQTAEYCNNLSHLEKIIGDTPLQAMSHPCGNYNQDTLDILRGMGIKLGFRSNMGVKEIKSLLEIPREDHANVAREMGL